MTRDAAAIQLAGLCACADCVAKQPWRQRGPRPHLTGDDYHRARARIARNMTRREQLIREGMWSEAWS